MQAAGPSSCLLLQQCNNCTALAGDWRGGKGRGSERAPCSLRAGRLVAVAVARSWAEPPASSAVRPPLLSSATAAPLLECSVVCSGHWPVPARSPVSRSAACTLPRRCRAARSTGAGAWCDAALAPADALPASHCPYPQARSPAAAQAVHRSRPVRCEAGARALARSRALVDCRPPPPVPPAVGSSPLMPPSLSLLSWAASRAASSLQAARLAPGLLAAASSVASPSCRRAPRSSSLRALASVASAPATDEMVQAPHKEFFRKARAGQRGLPGFADGWWGGAGGRRPSRAPSTAL